MTSDAKALNLIVSAEVLGKVNAFKSASITDLRYVCLKGSLMPAGLLDASASC